ncbi:MAG: type II toxin-antitoxin system VapC family toxin [Nitrospira sp.]|nr:type II toxin-antitoxin system VapC family toxin [Nitrospira sp.]
MKNVLVDTDILIDFLRGKEKAKAFLYSLVKEPVVYISASTIAELHAGMKEHEREQTEDLVDSLNMVDVNREIVEKAGQYKRTLKTQALELDDCIIAATAFVKQAVLATGNIKHYPMHDIEKI